MMAFMKTCIALLLLLCNLSEVLADDGLHLPESAVSCYRIEPGTIAGIVCADVLLTLIIVAVTYRWATFRHKKVEKANKVYMNVRANCKKT